MPKTDREGRLQAPPEALYPCSRKCCREDRTWPAEDIVWYDRQEEQLDEDGNVGRTEVDAGWYCGECAADLQIETTGPRLDEVLRAEGRGALRENERTDPACRQCAFYGRNARASTDAASRRLLEETHGISDADCCHPPL